LLAKVRQAILLFGQPETVVEGHTDGTGTEANNRELSQGRAESVMAYLLANETLPGDKIKAVGFGSQRPVASEATAEGRALNRRIDLIITPEVPGATP
jgi:outer membrane protein OmpA-like peptidoglycan-associated protein